MLTTFYVFYTVNKFLFLIFLWAQSVFGQMLDNRTGTAFTDKPFFNVEFIQSNKIHTINGQFTYKKPGEVMRATEYKYVYEFDSIGRLIASFETRKDDGTQDTTWNIYRYTDYNQLVEHKKGDGKGFTSIVFEYDDQKRVVKESYTREYLDSAGNIQRTILNSETMTYDDYGNQIKKTVFNSYGLPYMHEFSYYNEQGFLEERVERLTMTSLVTTYTYEYNEKGYIAKIRAMQTGSEIPYEEFLYEYDEHGNLLEKQIYRNGVFITEIEMIYNDKSKLLTYVLTRDAATNFIMIIGFKEYDFY